MRLHQIYPPLLFASRSVWASPQNSMSMSMSMSMAITPTPSASLAPCSSDAYTKWQSCSSSADAEISRCSSSSGGGANIQCECEQAAKGFSCLVSACPSHTAAICGSSLIVNDMCVLAGVSAAPVSHASCPSENIKSVIATLWPEIPSGVRGYLPSDVLNGLAGATGSAPSKTVGVMGAPSVTGAAAGEGLGSRGVARWVVVLGMAVAVTAGL